MRERESKSTCESVLEVDVTFFGAGTFCDVVLFLSQGSLTTLVLEGFPPEVLAAVLEAAFPPEELWLFTLLLAVTTVALVPEELWLLALLPVMFILPGVLDACESRPI